MKAASGRCVHTFDEKNRSQAPAEERKKAYLWQLLRPVVLRGRLLVQWSWLLALRGGLLANLSRSLVLLGRSYGECSRPHALRGRLLVQRSQNRLPTAMCGSENETSFRPTMRDQIWGNLEVTWSSSSESGEIASKNKSKTGSLCEITCRHMVKSRRVRSVDQYELELKRMVKFPAMINQSWQHERFS